MKTNFLVRGITSCMLLALFADPVGAQVGTFVGAGQTNNTNYTIGSAGTTTESPFSILWNFDNSPIVTGSGVQEHLMAAGNPSGFEDAGDQYGASGDPPPAFPRTTSNPSGGYTLSTGGSASGGFNRAMKVVFGAATRGGSPGLKFTLQAPPSMDESYRFRLDTLELGLLATGSGPTHIMLRSAADNYVQNLGIAAVARDSLWRAVSLPINDGFGQMQTYSLVGKADGGGNGAEPDFGSSQGVGTFDRIESGLAITKAGNDAAGEEMASAFGDDMRVVGTIWKTIGAQLGSGMLGINTTGSGSFNGSISVTGTLSLTAVMGGTVAIAGPISGVNGSITKTGAGLAVLSGSNSHQGSTSVMQGTLRLDHATALGHGPVVLYPGATLDLNNLPITNKIVTMGGTILNSGSYAGPQLLDSGSATFSAAFAGTTTIAAGARGNFGSTVSGSVDLSGIGTFSQAVSGAVTVSGSGSGQFNGPMSGNVQVTGSSAIAMLSGVVTGSVSPALGGLAVISGSIAPSAKVWVGNGGVLRLADGASFGQAFLPNIGTLEFTNSGSTTMSAVIYGGGGEVVMSGSGVTVLSGANLYTGGTRITAGTLRTSGSSALGTGPVNVGPAGKLVVDALLALGGSNAVTLAAGAVLESLDGASTPIAAGSDLGGVSMTSGLGGVAEILSGSASGGTLATTWLAGPAGGLSQTLDLHTPTDATRPFVLSMQYSGSASGDTWLGWKDGNGGWVNAVDGNILSLGLVSATGSALGYLGSFTDFQSAIGSSDIRSYLGAYGRDASTSTVWAVVNHNSEFAVVPVPEPATLALVTLAGGVLLPRILRRLSSRGAGQCRPDGRPNAL